MTVSVPVDLHSKTVVGFGASVAAVSTLAGTDIRCSFFVDANPAVHGQTLAGAPIRPPGAIADWLADNDADELYVIVFAYATRAVAAIFDQLEALGLDRGRHFADCSELQVASMAPRLRAATGIEPEPGLFEQVHRACLAADVDNRSSIAGTWLLQLLLREQVARGPGDIAEAGVYKGGSALVTLQLLGERAGDRDYHLFDSFEGLPELSAHDPASRAGEFADASADAVRARFADYPRVRVHAGLFEDTFPAVRDRSFSLAYIDCDLYEPAALCLDFFLPRLVPGGAVLLHDYWVAPDLALPPGAPEPFTGIRRAVDERDDIDLVAFPETTHVLVRPRRLRPA